MGRKLHQERRMHFCAKIKAVLPHALFVHCSSLTIQPIDIMVR